MSTANRTGDPNQRRLDLAKRRLENTLHNSSRIVMTQLLSSVAPTNMVTVEEALDVLQGALDSLKADAAKSARVRHGSD